MPDRLHLGALEDPHASLEQDAAKAPREQRRLDRSRARHEQSLAERGRGASALHGSEVDRLELLADSGCAEALYSAVPVRRLVGKGVDAQVTGLHVVGVDAMLLAPRADPVDDLIGLARHLECRIESEALGQVIEALPPAVDEAAVSPRRPTTADVLLEQHDSGVRSPFVHEVGGPHAGIAAADDHDIGIGVHRQRGGWRRIALGGQRLAQPPAALPAGDRQIVHRRRQRLVKDGLTTMRMRIAITMTARMIPIIRPRAPSAWNSADCAPAAS